MDSFSFNRFVYKQYLLSPQWKKLQLQALQQANFKCEMCGSDDKLQCHHKNYKNLYMESLKDLIILCNNCHFKEACIDNEKLNENSGPDIKNKNKNTIPFGIDDILPIGFIIFMILIIFSVIFLF